MPMYEFAFMLRAMPKPELKTTLIRVSRSILDAGGILRNIENLGFRAMPFKTSSRGVVHREANYFILKVNTAAQAVADLKEEYGRDVDIIRVNVLKSNPDPEISCTLEEELLPPSYRKEVQKMIKIGKHQMDKKKPKFKYGENIHYYPFQR